MQKAEKILFIIVTHKVIGVYYLSATAQYCLSQLQQPAIIVHFQCWSSYLKKRN